MERGQSRKYERCSNGKIFGQRVPVLRQRTWQKTNCPGIVTKRIPVRLYSSLAPVQQVFFLLQVVVYRKHGSAGTQGVGRFALVDG